MRALLCLARSVALPATLSATLAATLHAASPALAHPALVSSQPAEGASAGNLRQISLTFSEALLPALSGIELVMTAMPGMEHHQPMRMTGVKSSLAPDGVTLVATLGRALPAGTYEVTWHVASAQTQRAAGKLSFHVP